MDTLRAERRDLSRRLDAAELEYRFLMTKARDDLELSLKLRKNMEARQHLAARIAEIDAQLNDSL